jgi:hypothetical protein
MCLMYLLHIYEYGTLKPVQVIVRGAGRRGRIMEGMNQTGVHCMHVCCAPVQLLFTNKHFLKVFKAAILGHLT